MALLLGLRAHGDWDRTRVGTRSVLLLLLVLLEVRGRPRVLLLSPPVPLRAAHHHPPIVVHTPARRHLVLPQELSVDLPRLAKLRLEGGEVRACRRLGVVVVWVAELGWVARVGEGLEGWRVVDVSHAWARAGGWNVGWL